MDAIHLAVLLAAIVVVGGGARMLWCGHRAHDSRERRRGERRGSERRLT